MKCPTCKADFKKNANNQKFCSDYCRNTYHSFLLGKTKTLNIRKCKHCKKEFVRTNPKQCFCNNDCNIAISKIKRAPKIISCICCGKHFEQKTSQKTCSDKCRDQRAEDKLIGRKYKGLPPYNHDALVMQFYSVFN